VNWTELRDRAPLLCRTFPTETAVLAARAGGAAIEANERKTLLAQVRAGEQVDLELDLLAYEQAAGSRNRKAVRFRDGALSTLGRSGKGTPFLRDHEQGNLLARAGTVTASRAEKLGDGHYRVLQTAVLTAPWAVEAALLGNLDRVSIGFAPTGDVLCSACNTPVFGACWHRPGDVVKDGKAAGEIVEWVFTAAELVETSGVSVPAVPTAHIEGIRAALSAALEPAGRVRPGRNVNRIASLLGIAATAAEDEVDRAVERLNAERNALREQLSTAERSLAEAAARAAAHEATLARQAEDAWISEGLASGKVVPGAHEESLRAYFRRDAEGARAMLAAAPTITPAGRPRQSERPEPTVVTGVTGAQRQLRDAGFNYDVVKAQLAELGIKDPDAVLARRYGGEV
jgi:phage head maturation protease